MTRSPYLDYVWGRSSPNDPRVPLHYPLPAVLVIAGSLYLGALYYAIGAGIRRRWNPWSGFVVGMGVGVFVYRGFESLFLGGSSTSSMVLGLLLVSNPYMEDADPRPITARDALTTSRATRALKSPQTATRDETGSSRRSGRDH